jgi:predicted RNA-binding protein with PUA-like domain
MDGATIANHRSSRWRALRLLAKAAMTIRADRRYWLFKSEPKTFSWDDLWRAKGRRTSWEGVRNYQARNLLRDEIQVGDGVLFYHSSTEPLAVVGECEVVKAGYPDHTAWEPDAPYYDESSDPAAPTWYMVDIRAVRPFRAPVTREQLAKSKELSGMMVLQRGARLSVQPVTPAEWRAVLQLGGVS